MKSLIGAGLATAAALGLASAGIGSAPQVGPGQERAKERLRQKLAAEKARTSGAPPVGVSRQVRRWRERRGLAS